VIQLQTTAAMYVVHVPSSEVAISICGLQWNRIVRIRAQTCERASHLPSATAQLRFHADELPRIRLPHVRGTFKT
jgi:hypothetical protein